MPPRFVYWTILIDGKPTAFRARDVQELLPTVNQLKRKNTDVVVKWFARGRLWDSPEAERAAQYGPPQPAEKRNRDWRPGGAHKDPRDRFKKKNRPERAWSEADRDRDRPPRREADRDRKPWVNKPARPPRDADRKPWQSKPVGPPRGDRKPWEKKPFGPPRGDRKPWGTTPSGPRNDRPWQTKPTGPRADRKPWQNKPSGPPRGDRKPWEKRAAAPPRRSPGDRSPGEGGFRRDRPPFKKKRDDEPDKS